MWAVVIGDDYAGVKFFDTEKEAGAAADAAALKTTLGTKVYIYKAIKAYYVSPSVMVQDLSVDEVK